VKRLLLALAALALGGGSAVADDVGVIAVRPVHSPVSAVELTRALEVALRARGDVAVDNPSRAARGRLSAGAVLADRLDGFTETSELMRSGWQSYASVQYTFARARLAEARQRALTLTDLAGGVELFAEVTLRLGVIKHELRDVAGAADDFRLAHRLAPTRPVTSDHFKPNIVTAFQAAVAAAIPRRGVSVSRSPAGATVIVDGRIVGPNETVDLDEGLHLVVGMRPGYRSERRLVRVERSTTEIAVALEPDLRSSPLFGGELTAGAEEGPATRLASTIALFAELDGIIVAAAVWRGGEPALVGQWCGGEPLSCGRAVEIRFAGERGLAAATIELVDRARAEERRFPVTVLGDARITNPEKRESDAVITRSPWWKNKWLWIGVGAGAVAAGTAAALLVSDGDLRVVIEAPTCQFGGC
jgi:hypothetical protein